MKIVCGGQYRVRVRVIQDEDAEDPQGWDNLGKMMCWHSRHQLGQRHSCKTPAERKAWVVHKLTGKLPRTGESAAKRYSELICLELPLYLFDHGSLTISTTPFSCPFDSGQVGWIWCSWKAARREFGMARSAEQRRLVQERARVAIQQEVEIYAQWLQGDVYNFVIERDDAWSFEWEPIYYGPGGFYGHDNDANGLLSELDALDPTYRSKLVETP